MCGSSFLLIPSTESRYEIPKKKDNGFAADRSLSHRIIWGLTARFASHEHKSALAVFSFVSVVPNRQIISLGERKSRAQESSYRKESHGAPVTTKLNNQIYIDMLMPAIQLSNGIVEHGISL